MRIALLAAVLSAAAASAAADIITTTDVLVIEGRVIEVSDDKVVILIHQGEGKWGRIAIPRSRVASIEYDLSRRLEELAQDDWLGRYRLGVWALEHGMSDEALAIFAEVAGKQDVPADANLRAGRLLEEKGRLKEALERYKAYALAAPEDKDVLAKIEELAKKLAASEPKAAPPAAGRPSEGLETEQWRYERWGNKADIAVVKDPDGNQMLRVIMDGTGSSDKIAISVKKDVNLSDKSRISFSTHNTSGAPIQVALALITASGYYEARPVTAKPDWTLDLGLDLKGNQFKCQANNWQFSSPVPDLDKVQAVLFLVYNGKRKGVFYFDEVLFK